MDKVRYWLSFDLGLRGNYDELYEWLDTVGAKECGDNVATFLSTKTREQIAKELSGFLGSDKNVKVYAVTRKHGGKFILGRRKAAAWIGYSRLAVDSEEER